jgi:hypothetical protein
LEAIDGGKLRVMGERSLKVRTDTEVERLCGA